MQGLRVCVPGSKGPTATGVGGEDEERPLTVRTSTTALTCHYTFVFWEVSREIVHLFRPSRKGARAGVTQEGEVADVGEQLWQKYSPGFAGGHLGVLVLAVVTRGWVPVGAGRAGSCTLNPREKECNVGRCGGRG